MGVCEYIYVSVSSQNKTSKGRLSVSQRLDGSWVGGMKGEGSKNGRGRSRRNEYPGTDSAFTFFPFFFPFFSLAELKFVAFWAEKITFILIGCPSLKV